MTNLWERLQRYHSASERAIFGFSLVGILTVVHLFIQQTRNFDRGCFGFSGLDSGQMAFDCSTVVSSSAGTFLGLSNLTWGIGFYAAVLVLTFAVFWMKARPRGWVHATRGVLLAGGIGYTGYLVYVQMVQLNAVCALCLVSAAITTVLFGIQGAVIATDFHSEEMTMTERMFKRDLTVYVYCMVFTAILVGADLTYFNALSSPADEAAAAHEQQYSGAACQLDTEKDPVSNPGSLVSFQDVTKGPADAAVTIVEYFDPNCPHCKTFHGTMKELVAEYRDEVQFVFKPFPLRGSSVPEIQALYIANQEGKFTEMLEAQYARQSRSGITKPDLRAIASEIGMNPDVLLSRIDQDKFRSQIVEQRKRAIDIGVNSTPTVLVNGHFAQSRSTECLKVFIERARKGALGSSSSR